jgi:hypothetical protein
MLNAIHGSHGIMAVIAERANCTTMTVWRKLKQYPELQKVLEKEKEMVRATMNDMADGVIFKALQDDDRKVAMWVKERLGANEGYNPAVKLETEKSGGGLHIVVHKSKELETDNE